MKRLLILFTLMTYALVGCAGPSRWTKPDFHQGTLEKDREECSQSIDQNLSPEAFGKALEECLAQKGYKYHEVEVKSERNKSPTAKTVLLSALIITGTAAGIALLILAAALGGAGASLGH